MTQADSYTETEQEWKTYSEKLVGGSGSILRVLIIVAIIEVLVVAVTYIGLVYTGCTDYLDFLLSQPLAVGSALVFYAYLPVALIFVKRTMLNSISDLPMKDEDDKKQFLKRSEYYSRRLVTAALTIWILMSIVLTPFNPIIGGDFPLTLDVIPFVIVKIVLWTLLNVPILDAMIFIPKLLMLPKAVSNKLSIRPLEPDRCGGVKALGDLYLVSSVLVAIAGTIIVATSGGFEVTAYGYIMALIYGILAIIIFIIPQGSVSKLMREEKEENLREISEELEQLRVTMRNSEPEELMSTFLRVQSLIMLYEQFEKLRNYPFDTSMLQKVITAGLLPIATKFVLPLIGLGF